MERTSTSAASDDNADIKRGPIKGPQAFAGALSILAFTAFALWAMWGLEAGSLRQMGPGMLPRTLAVLIGACGAALLMLAILKHGSHLERLSLRAPFFVGLSIVVFGLTIRQFGMAVAGPLAMIIGGFATSEARPVELVIFAAVMTAFCIGLFRYALNLPIPVLILPGIYI